MSETVVVGMLGKPFGVHGEVYIQADPDLTHDFEPGTVYTTADGRQFVTTSTHIHGNRRLIAFEGVREREAAEALRGTVLLLSRSEVELSADAQWADDHIGREVHDGDGALIGTVAGFLDGPAHDYLVVTRPDAEQVLVPLVDALVDLGGPVVVVRAIPGLLD